VRPLLAAALFAFAALPAQEETMTGADLLKMCNSAPNTCNAYLRGAVAMYEAVVAEAKEVAWFCPPKDGDFTVLRRLYVEWAAENANDLPQPVMVAVEAMLADAYSCSD
jgi:hypothetical protein